MIENRTSQRAEHGQSHADLAAAPFSVRVGLAAGLTRRVLASDAFARPTRGVRWTLEPRDVPGRAQGIAPALGPNSAFSHLTSASLHDLPLSYSMESDDRIHVIQPIDECRMRRPGIVGHRALHPREVVTVKGLPVVGLADTWVDLGELIGRGKPVGLDDMVVLGDAIATRLGSARPLALALARRVRPRGKLTLLEALDEIRVGARSPRETLARLMLVRCGLPEPKLNQAVISSSGELLGVTDLLWEEQRVVGEYQGQEFHDGEQQRERDGVRYDGFAADAWTVEQIWQADMADVGARHACVMRFADALGVDASALELSNSEPRFFSRHVMELALQRSEAFSRRRIA